MAIYTYKGFHLQYQMCVCIYKMTRIKHLLFSIGLVLCIAQGNAECGYKSCHPTKDDQLNIHLVPHTHDDLGWLKTFEQYYYGSHNDIQQAGVQYILESVVEALQKNSDRRFIYVETGFFWKWWLNQDEDKRNAVKELVNNGQLEFISGGWSMNDEADTYYQATIDQMTWGLRKLNETFGECGRPRVAWQIDPFGHSREMASIFAQIGFDGFFLNRIDSQDLQLRRNSTNMEFVWRGSPDNLGQSTDIYTNILFRHYSAPSGLCFDVECTDEPIIDDPNSPEYNVEQKALDFINNWITPATEGYASNNILVPMGDDFRYQYAGKNFFNTDKLIKYMNGREFNGKRYNVIYSTPSCYLNAVYQSTNGTLKSPLKTDDFFPYASSAHNYWTGYFTSRPTGKGYGRYSNNFLQICKQLSVVTNLTSSEETSKLDTLRESLGVFQHHDAITGTEKEKVAYDYLHLLHNGITKCEEIVDQALRDLVKSSHMSFTTCPLLNISECARTENEDNLVITVYNPLGKFVNKYVRLPIVDNVSEIFITDPDGQELVTQIIPIHGNVIKVPGRNSSAQYELIFRAANIPPLGFKSFYYQRNPQKARTPMEHVPYKNERRTIIESYRGSEVVLTNEKGLKLTTGTAYYYYTGFVGNSSSDEFSPSTPYIFRPDPDIPVQPVSKDYDFITYQGPLITETHWYFNDWLSYIHRTFSDSTISEFVHLVGPLPYEEKGIEVIVRFKTDLEYDDKVYTDTNGREIIERVRNFRPTWNVNITEPEAGNYYPIVTGVSISNGSSAGIAIVNDRAQGGGSVNYQYLEFMIHRNTINHGGGVGEPLNEQAYGTGVVSRGSHYLISTGSEYSQPKDKTPKEVAQEVNSDSWVFFASPNGLSFEDYRAAHVMEYSAFGNISLPRNVHILTLEPWGPSTVLLRLENFVGKEDLWHSGTSTVNIQELFSAFNVISLRETTLGGNQWLEENSRIIFNRADETPKVVQQENDFNVTLEPMQIRTFVVTISY